MRRISPEGRRHRRLVLKAAAAAGVVQLAAPFIIKARGDVPIKFGLDDPLTGDLVQIGGPLKTLAISTDALSIEKDSIPGGRRSGV
ncbi:hypothetical protein ACFPAA_20325, partial [Paraburkholderia caffeinitolerans]